MRQPIRKMPVISTLQLMVVIGLSLKFGAILAAVTRVKR